MANWKYRLDLSHFFHSEEKTLEEKTKQIIFNIRRARWYNEDLYYFDLLEEILEEMADAGEADDVEWFDACWNAAYDIFDAERIWVVTR